MGLPQPLDVNTRLNQLARWLGYTKVYGPGQGEEGDAQLLLAALAKGEILILRLNADERAAFTDALERLSHRDASGLFRRVAGLIKLQKEITHELETR